MKNIVKPLVFVVILVFVILIIENGLATIPNSYTVKRNCLEKNINTIQVLIFGSSEANYGINSEILNKNSCNLANSSQDLYFDSEILNRHIDELHDLKVVILPISYFSLYYNLDNTEEYWRKYFYYYFWGIRSKTNKSTDIRNYSLTFLYTPEKSFSYLKKGFKVNLTENNDVKGFYHANKTIDGGGNALRQISYMDEKYYKDNIGLLMNMIEILKAKQVKVVLISLPVSKNYYDNIDKEKYKLTRKTLDQIATENKLLFLDYFRDSRFKDSDFIDGADHLSENGANRLSQMLKLEIQR